LIKTEPNRKWSLLCIAIPVSATSPFNA
jgi:hypothetical protein